MVLSQKKARGIHWKQAASVNAIDVAAVRLNRVQAAVRMAPFQLKMRRYRHIILSFGRATEIKYIISKAKRHFAQPTRAGGSDCSRKITCRPTPPTLVKTVYDKGKLATNILLEMSSKRDQMGNKRTKEASRLQGV